MRQSACAIIVMGALTLAGCYGANQAALPPVTSSMGTLSLTCPSSGAVGAIGVQCTYSNPGYAGDYTLSRSLFAPSTCLFSSITNSSFTVTDSTAEQCTVILAATSGSKSAVEVTIQFIGPLVLVCPSAGVTGTTGITCTYTNPVYAGSYTASGSTATCSVGVPSAGSFTVTDSAGENCTVTLTPNSGPEGAASSKIAFSAPAAVGPLSLSCPSGATVKTTVTCTYSNPNYAGGYTASGSTATCTAGTPSAGSLTVTDSVVENCTVTLTPTTGTEPAATAVINFQASGGGGGGGGCALFKATPGEATPSVVTC